MKRCYIVGAGSFDAPAFTPAAADLVIAADAGYRWTRSLGIRTDLLVGDLDSLGEAPPGVELIRLAVEKDDSDTQHAIDVGLARGYRDFRLYGMLGGRLDHTFGNLTMLLYLARRGARGVIVSERTAITTVTAGELNLTPAQGNVSAFALGGTAQGVGMSGLRYECRDAVFSPDLTLGLSNEMLGRPARIRVERGTLLVFCPIEALEA